ncbi:hypothetical protein JRI60_37025 [Archangium violaceum]|uniref:hypothetical protein n=1 Tax=Archangium violaceum TaxID=83451 RepID=UPI001951C9D4|nr:hypothetical protein [Archangium violaceum]QRN94682.1 hypothetical protein JRI60_37025 [Archangium violaceum]
MLTAMTVALGVLLSAPPEKPSGKPSTVHAAKPAPAPVDGVSAIIEAAQDHLIVGVGERHHSAPTHEFLHRLVHDPRFPTAFQDIVVEFGNSRYQGVMDRYVAGESVPAEELRLAWRNTTQLLVWDSPLYEQFFTTVRDVSKGGIASRVASWRPGTLARLAGTSLGAESSALLMSGTIRILRMVDGKHVPVTLEPKDCPPLEEHGDRRAREGGEEGPAPFPVGPSAARARPERPSVHPRTSRSLPG